jgi:hypothetical protein
MVQLGLKLTDVNTGKAASYGSTGDHSNSRNICGTNFSNLQNYGMEQVGLR